MASKDDYVLALKQRLVEYQQAIETERAKLQALMEEIEKKEERAVYIQRLLEAEGLNLGAEGLSSFAKSIPDAAHEVMKQQQIKEPMHYRKLSDLVIQHGKNIPGKNPAANLIAHLGRDDRFERTGRGLYALKEWGIKSKPKRRKKRRKKR